MNLKTLTDTKGLVAPVVSVATKVIGVVGAALSVTDAVMSWVLPNPVRAECLERRQEVWENVVALTAALNQFRSQILRPPQED